jgi:hypothetical protein
MDIKKISNGSIPIPGTKQKGTSEASQLDFQKLLQEAKSSNKTASSCTASPLSKGVGEIPSDPALAVKALNLLAETVELPQIRSQGIKAAENTLGLLEKYQMAMADPQMSLKKVDHWVQSLAKDVNDLISFSDKLPAADPLKEIINEIGIVSEVEIQKFNRGEYI